MVRITTSIEIAASPATVRAKFLDFSSLSTYHANGWIKSIAPLIPGKPITTGDKVKAVIELGAMEPTVVENSPAAFTWANGIGAIFLGRHAFEFRASEMTTGGTTFVQEEIFMGAFKFVMGDNFVAKMLGLREKTTRGFEGYNRDLKNAVEGGEGKE